MVVFHFEKSVHFTNISFIFQESGLPNTADARFTRELHSIRAHHMHYTILLDDYQGHVRFIMDTRNPMQESFLSADRKFSQVILRRECDILLIQINKLKNRLCMHERRLENITGMVNCFHKKEFINKVRTLMPLSAFQQYSHYY